MTSNGGSHDSLGPGFRRDDGNFIVHRSPTAVAPLVAAAAYNRATSPASVFRVSSRNR